MEILKRVSDHMRETYGANLADLEITTTPGYWRDKMPKRHLGHPLHGCIGFKGEFRATYQYLDPRREKGRFTSPYRTWKAVRQQTGTIC